MASGWTLKAHRYLDGRKELRLHALEGASAVVAPETVEALADGGLIDSNKKFPAATFWLTPKGQARLAAADQEGWRMEFAPLGAGNCGPRRSSTCVDDA